MEKEKEEEKFDIYKALMEITNKLSNYFYNYDIKVNPGDHDSFKFIINHNDGYYHEVMQFKKIRFNETFEEYVNRIFNNIVKSHKHFTSKKFHLLNGSHSFQFDKEIRIKILNLAKKVFSDNYKGIEIIESVYSNSMFKCYLIAMARTKAMLKRKNEPIMYIHIYEFFSLTLFDKIYGYESNPNDDWSNDWVEINLLIGNSLDIE